MLSAGGWGADLAREFAESSPFWRQLEVAERIAATRDKSLLVPMERWLRHDDRHVRGNAALVFAAMGDERGWSVIKEMLRDRGPRGEGQGIPNARWSLAAQISADRYYAVHLLGMLRDARAVPLLEPLLADDQVNFKVPWSLGQIGGPEAVRVLLLALRNENVDVRVIAIESVRELGAREALPVLRTLLMDEAHNHFGQPTTVGAAARAAIAKLEVR